MNNIQYYEPLKLDNGYIISCDGVRIKFQIAKNLASEFSQYVFMSLRSDIECYPIRTTLASFKQMATITYSNGVSMTLGFCFNGATRIAENGLDNFYVGYLDFNLNKVGAYDRFWSDYRYIKSCCDYFEIMRSDIALDIPIERNRVVLEKDKRAYHLTMYSNVNKTENLGRRNNIGYIKVYNKQLESGLDYTLTRIEVTCLLNELSYLDNFPKIYILNDIQFDFKILDLKDTDIVILDMENTLLVNGLDPGLMKFKSIGRKKREKLKPYLLPESSAIGLNSDVLLLRQFFDRIKEVLQL